MRLLGAWMLLSLVCVAQSVITPRSRDANNNPATNLITICTTNPGSGTCGSLVTTYTSITLGTSCTGTLAALSGTDCSNPGNSDATGNIVAFAAPGNYWCQYKRSSTAVAYSVACTSALASGGGTPGGSNTQIQFNNSSLFGGISNVTAGSLLASQGTSETPTFQTKAICDTRDMAGADLGARINACDALLGANPGEIQANEHSTTTSPTPTQVVIGAGHTLRLGPGVYTNNHTEYVPSFLLNDNASLICTGWSTIIQNSTDPTDSENMVVGDYNGSQPNYLGNTDGRIGNVNQYHSSGIRIEGCHFMDSGLGIGGPLTGTIALHNCSNCQVKNNWMDGIVGTEMTLSGAYSLTGTGCAAIGHPNSDCIGNFGVTDEISSNLLNGPKDAAISVINNEKVNIHDNFFHGHGNGAAAFIDLESNTSDDHMAYIDIHDNLMDMTDALNSVYGITTQSSGANVHHHKIHDNLMWGPCSGTNHFISGINTSFADDTEIYNNTIHCPVSDAMDITGIVGDPMVRTWIHDNKIFCPEQRAIALTNYVTDSIIERNAVNTPVSGCAGASVNYRSLLYSTIAELTNTNVRNIFRGNAAARVIVQGTGSVNFDSSDITGTSRAFPVPVGFPSAVSGDVSFTQSSPPTLSTANGPNALDIMGGTCVLTPQQPWFWKVTAVGANGGKTTSSNEVTATEGGASGCPILSWTYVPGAASYNVYRSATTNTELLVANVPAARLAYYDIGGQTPGAAVPVTNTTGQIVAAGPITSPSYNSALANGGLSGAEGTGALVPVGAGLDVMWPDSTAHRWIMNNNNGGNQNIIGTQDFQAVYNHSGTQQTTPHIVQDSCTLGTDCGVTLTGASVYTNSTSYTCTCADDTAIAACKVAQTSGSAFTITGTGTDAIRYLCAGN